MKSSHGREKGDLFSIGKLKGGIQSLQRFLQEKGKERTIRWEGPLEEREGFGSFFSLRKNGRGEGKTISLSLFYLKRISIGIPRGGEELQLL